MHFSKLPKCTRFQVSKKCSRAKALAQLLPVEHQEALTDYSWDKEDSLDELDEAANDNFADNNKTSDAPNNQAGICSD
jgi:hypothetical protein